MEKLHIWLRLSSFNFGSVLKNLPKRGKVLDFGCGFGLFSKIMKKNNPKLQISAYDYDKNKLLGAKKYLKDLDINILKILTGKPKFDAIVILDVLYLLPSRQRVKLLRKFAKMIKQNGKIIISFVPKELSLRYYLAFAQEWVMVKLLSKTKGGVIDFESEEWMETTLKKLKFKIVRKETLPTPFLWWHKHRLYAAIKSGR